MLFLFFSFSISVFTPDHSVSLSVQVPWYEVPIFDQIFCFFCDHSMFLAQSYLETTLQEFSNLNDEETQLKNAKSLIGPELESLLKAQLDLFYSPRIEMYRELARQFGGSSLPYIITVGKKLDFVFPDGIPHFERSEIDIQSFDFQFGKSPEIIIYVNLQNEKASKVVSQLISDQQEFILRPIGQTKRFGVNLRGFGIEMRPFKYSMEYG